MYSFLTFIKAYKIPITVSFLSLVFFVLFTEPAYAQGIGDDIAGVVYGICMTIGGWVIGFGGLLLDLSIKLLVVEMGLRFLGDGTSSGIGVAVNDFWTMARDILNMFFIYGLIYIGIKTILNSEDSGTRRALGHLIAAAVLVNFSLYITQVVIDFSNVMATQVYSQMISGVSGNFNSDIMQPGTDKSISGAFMQATNIVSMVGDPDNNKSLSDEVGGAGRLFGYSLMMMFFLIIAGIFFIMGAVMIVSRFVVLILYMVFSPVMFLGWVIPNFANISTKWWHGFFKQAFFAPLYIFMLYLSLHATQLMTKSVTGTGSSFTDAYAGGEAPNADGFTMFLYLIVMIGFLYASVKVAQMMSISGAGGTLKMGNALRKRAQGVAGGLSIGMAARIGRGVIGQRAQGYADSDALKDAAAKGGAGGMFARAQLVAARKIGDSSFDARRVGGVGKTLGIGEGKKGGYKTRRDEVIKKEQEFTKNLGEVGDDDTTVMSLTRDKERHEEKLAGFKLTKAQGYDLTTPEGRELKAENEKAIIDTEKAIKDAEVTIKREKSRRQLGSSGDQQKKQEADKELQKKKQDYAAAKAEVTRIYNDAEATVAERNLAVEREKIAKDAHRKARKDSRKANKGNTLGYAGVLEQSNWLQSAAVGRVTNQDHKAGKEIRETYTKKIKKTKEDERNDTLVDEVKKTRPKEE